MTNEKAIMCLEDMKIKVPIPKAAKQARENNEALDVAIKALQSAEPKKIRGQWSIKGQAIDTVRGYWAKCSACGHSVFGGGNYCSNCGSYNKGEVTT